jgi:hypothetical protein
MVQRGGDVRFHALERVTAKEVHKLIVENVDRSCRLITDEFPVYTTIGRTFKGGHGKVLHKAKEYVRRGTDIHSNTIEGVFSLIQRGLMGTFIRLTVSTYPIT